MMGWIRRRFITGFFVTVPLVISVFAFVWIFRFIDGLVGPWYEEWRGPAPPGVGIVMTALLVLLVGALTTNVLGKRVLQRAEGALLRVPVFRTIYSPVKQLVLVVGALATNVLGKQVLQRGEGYLLRVPVFRTIYSPVKQLVLAFSPDNEYGFKRVVLLEDSSRGFMLGFLTKEFTLDRGSGPEPLIAVYVPTNHLYLGDVIIVPRERASFPDITVEQGIRIFLTGGVAISSRLRARHGTDRVADFRI